ncbi:MAG: UDP-glucose 4-epimerase GalE [Bacteroidetes bacterium]|nr:UDP-glucose 4-epimerase GalE [Bacteroidota bacterium]
MTVLVTGGTGYIGSHTVVELQQKGYEVIIIDNLSNSTLEMLDGIEKITGIKPLYINLDLCDAEGVSRFFETHKNISAIIHFAAFKAVGESVAFPLKYYSNNLLSLVNVLQGAMQAGVNLKGFVFSSSCTVYGSPDSLPVSEAAPLKPASSPYGNTKRICEEILQDTVNQANFKAISLRYFNPVGAHDSAIIGELPLGTPNNLVPIITQTAIGKRKKSVEIFGSDYATPDGTCVRDYIHVVDLAQAHVIAIERILNGKSKSNCEVFNIGTGIGYSVLEMVLLFEKISGLKLDYKMANRRPGDIESIYADVSLSSKELGWKAQRNLENMLATSWNWEKKLALQNQKT